MFWELIFLQQGFLKMFNRCDKQQRIHFYYDVCIVEVSSINFLKPTGYVMHQQFNIQQLYTLPTLYLCVLYLSENKQRLVPLTA